MDTHTFVKRTYQPSVRAFLEALASDPQINFPTIVEVTDDGYVMAYVEGKTLTEIVNASGPLSPDTAQAYMLQLLCAAEYLHRFRIVHRDIKPDNIVITDDGTLKLIDFDISRRIVTSKTRDTELLGTGGYAAPEQYGFMQTDERSDIYSIGVVYNFMLTGKMPIEELAPGSAGKIIRKCTSIKPGDRYRNVRRLRKDVRRNAFTAYRLTELIPGIRSGNLFIMIPAFLGYIVFIGAIIPAVIEEISAAGAPMIRISYAVTSVLLMLYALLFFAVLFDCGDIVRRIRFPIRSYPVRRVLFPLIIYGISALAEHLFFRFSWQSALLQGNICFLPIMTVIDVVIGLFFS